MDSLKETSAGNDEHSICIGGDAETRTSVMRATCNGKASKGNLTTGEQSTLNRTHPCDLLDTHRDIARRLPPSAGIRGYPIKTPACIATSSRAHLIVLIEPGRSPPLERTFDRQARLRVASAPNNTLPTGGAASIFVRTHQIRRANLAYDLDGLDDEDDGCMEEMEEPLAVDDGRCTIRTTVHGPIPLHTSVLAACAPPFKFTMLRYDKGAPLIHLAPCLISSCLAHAHPLALNTTASMPEGRRGDSEDTQTLLRIHSISASPIPIFRPLHIAVSVISTYKSDSRPSLIEKARGLGRVSGYLVAWSSATTLPASSQPPSSHTSTSAGIISTHSNIHPSPSVQDPFIPGVQVVKLPENLAKLSSLGTASRKSDRCAPTLTPRARTRLPSPLPTRRAPHKRRTPPSPSRRLLPRGPFNLAFSALTPAVPVPALASAAKKPLEKHFYIGLFFSTHRGDLPACDVQRGPFPSTPRYFAVCVTREVLAVQRENAGSTVPHQLHTAEIHLSRHHRAYPTSGG
ncbi:hypothetical protein B0H11DRAFT_2261220 [Mycena galericulata]|nr:hypothetical protein B0H11DRAFT_2261220 [Mycena galericulata]